MSRREIRCIFLPGPNACLSWVHIHFAMCAGKGSRWYVLVLGGQTEGAHTGYLVEDMLVGTLKRQGELITFIVYFELSVDFLKH